MSKPVSAGGVGIHVTPHRLRHIWATMALESGLPREVIQYQLGHLASQSTDQYSHVSPEWGGSGRPLRTGTEVEPAVLERL